MEKKTSKTPKFNLYKKEQLVLTIILLCFVLSGIGLPKLKDYLHPVEIPVEDSHEIEEPNIDTNIDTEVEVDEDINAESELDEPEVIDDVVEDTDIEVSNQKPSTTTKPSNEPIKESPKNPEQNSSVAEVPKEPEKVWVPPVYETVHHEAVYETVRIVICNYCSEEFGSVGEFQVHKEEHGG